MDKGKLIIISLIILLGLGILGVWWWASFAPSNFEGLAKCLSEKGVKFYGAFWCPHCQSQKSAFGSAKKYLPYIECSAPDGRTQLQVCNEAGIQSYPTWEFPDGTREIGKLSMQQLSDKSSCPLAQ